MKEVKSDLNILRKNTYDATKQAIVDLNLRGTQKGRDAGTEENEDSEESTLKTTIFYEEKENNFELLITYDTLSPREQLEEPGPELVPKLILLSI